MSSYASLCHLEDGDKLDVAWSFVDEEVRLAIWADEGKVDARVYLSKAEAEHIRDLISYAIGKIEDWKKD